MNKYVKYAIGIVVIVVVVWLSFIGRNLGFRSACPNNETIISLPQSLQNITLQFEYDFELFHRQSVGNDKCLLYAYANVIEEQVLNDKWEGGRIKKGTSLHLIKIVNSVQEDYLGSRLNPGPYVSMILSDNSRNEYIMSASNLGISGDNKVSYWVGSKKQGYLTYDFFDKYVSK